MQQACGRVSRGRCCICDVSISGVLQHQRALLLATSCSCSMCRFSTKTLLFHKFLHYLYHCEGRAMVQMP